MRQIPYDMPGDPELAERPPELAEGRDDTWVLASDDPYLPVFYGTINIWSHLGNGRALGERSINQCCQTEDFLLLGELLGEAVARDRPARGGPRVRRDDAPVLPAPRAAAARELQGAREHPAPRVVRGGPARDPDAAGGRPHGRHRLDARVQEGGAGGPLRALPDHGGRDRRRALPGAGRAVQRVRGLGRDGAGPRVVRASGRRLDRKGQPSRRDAPREGAPRWSINSNRAKRATNAWAARSSALVDVVAQSVGFMGPVFSAAFIIPLIIGVNAAARRRRDVSAARRAAGRHRRVRARVDRRAVREADPRGRLSLRLRVERPWLGDRNGVRLPLLRRARSSSTTGLGVLDRRLRARQPDARSCSAWRTGSSRSGCGALIFALGLFAGPVLRRADLDACAADPGVGLDRRRAHVLPVDHRPAGRRQRLREGVRPDAVRRTGSAASCSVSCTAC